MMVAKILPTAENEKLRGKEEAIPFIIWIYISLWIVLSSTAILFNKYLLDNLDFHFPAILTCWHLLFSTIMTQILARTTTLLDGRKTVRMTPRIYLRAIVPIGVLFSTSLVCSNQTYLYLSVAFIQMLKASAPVAVLLTSYAFRVSTPSLPTILTVLCIAFGVLLASIGEIKFVWIGFFFQTGSIFSEAIRLILIQILLTEEGGGGAKMDSLVALYYYAPVCTGINFLVAAVTEFGSFGTEHVYHAGIGILVFNAGLAFLLNAGSVFLISKTSGLVMTLLGVLKNILLVLSSVLFFGTIIMPLQILGYTIALLGLLYYGVGYDGLQTYYSSSAKFARGAWECEDGGGGIGGRLRWRGKSMGGVGKGGLVRKGLVLVVGCVCVLGLFVGMSGLKKGGVRRGEWFDLDA